MSFRHALAAAAALLVATTAASAQDLESAVTPMARFTWHFGAARPATSELSLRLDYAQPGLHSAALPALAQWTVSSSGAEVLSFNGLPLHQGNFFATETGAAPASDSMGPGVRVGLILLGAGGATALIVGAAGHAAKENNPSVSDNQSGVACNNNPVGSSCVIGGGNGGNGG